MRCAGADDAGVAGDGTFDHGVALGDLVGDGFEQSLTMFGVQQDDGCSLVVVHFGMVFKSPRVISAIRGNLR